MNKRFTLLLLFLAPLICFSQASQKFSFSLTEKDSLHPHSSLVINNARLQHIEKLPNQPDSLAQLKLNACSQRFLHALLESMQTCILDSLTIHQLAFDDHPTKDKATMIPIPLPTSIKAIHLISTPKNLPERFVFPHGLRSFRIQKSSIAQVPSQLYRSRNLEQLEFSQTNISQLPSFVYHFKLLKSLNLSGTQFENTRKLMVKTPISRLDSLYLPGFYPGDVRQSLVDHFSKTVITFDKESIVAMESERPSVNYQKIKVKNCPKAYSMAYYDYLTTIRSPQYQVDFDATPYEQRFADLNYVRGDVRNPLKYYHNLSIKVYKARSKRVYFQLVDNSTNQSEFPELKVYQYFYFTTDDFSVKEFKKWTSTSGFKKRQWEDVRIHYNHSKSQFSFVLKHESGFDTLSTYPVESLMNEHINNRQLLQSYTKYQRHLNQIAHRFDENLAKDKEYYDNRISRIQHDIWKRIRELSMSDIERKMTKSEWLGYVQSVINQEPLSLSKAPAEYNSLHRYLGLLNYPSTKTQCSEECATKLHFESPNGNRLIVKRMFIIDLDNDQFHTQQGSLGVDPNEISLPDDSQIVLVAELLNGQLAYSATMCPKDLETIRNRGQFLLKLTPLNQEFGTLEVLRKKIRI